MGISFSFKKGEAFYIPFNDYLESASELQEVCLFETTNAKPILFKSNPFLEQLKGIFQDENIMKYTHNGKYDVQVLSQYGIDVKGLYFDTMIASFLLFPLEKVSLKECAARHLDMQLTSYEELVGKGAKQMLFSECSLGDAMNYACSDADATYQLMEFFKPLLKKQKLDRLFFNIEMPLQYVLQKMEMQGVSVDLEALSELKLKFEKRVSQIQKEIFSMIGKVINLNSSQQLSIVLYDDLNLPVIKKTKTGRSTDNSVLEELKNEHDIIKLIIEYRSLEKLLTTYIYSLGQLKSPKTNKIHTSFNQTIAITGRLTSSRPNLQNIPIRSQNGMEIRKAFTASTKEHLLMSADYSQIELRIMAHLSQDPAMVQFFLNNEDIHQSTAASIFNIECNEVSKQQRYFAKSINFGIIYGMSAKALSRQLQISKDDAQQFIDTYFERFTGVKKFIDHTIESARKAQGVSTEFDRFRPLPSINAPNWSIRKFNERAAVNTVLQGTAADLIKLAMIHIQREIESLSLRSRMVIQVHDELVFDVPQDEFVKLKEIVVRTMSSVKSYRVPLVVDVESGYSWCYA